MQSVYITTKAMSLNPAQDEVYSIQHYVIMFLSDLPQVGGFLCVLRFLQPIHTTDLHHIDEIFFKVALSIILSNP